MPLENCDTKTKILMATAEIIGREKNLNLTVREIASRAKVNVASINYYFGSKGKLLEEVETHLLNNVRLVYPDLENKALPTEERIINWANSLIKNLIDYPGIIYLIGTRVLERENTSLDLYLSLLETDITPLVEKLGQDSRDDETKFKVLQLISGIVYPVLILSSESGASGINIADDGVRKKYIASLVESLK